MKVLHINSNYLYTHLHDELLNELEQKKVNNIVFTAVNPNKLAKVDVENNNKVVRAEIIKNLDRYFFFKKQKKILDKITSLFDLDEFCLLHAHTLFTDGYSAYQLNKIYKIPYVITVRNTDVNSFFKRRILLRKTGIDILKNASKIIFLSPTYRDIVVDKYVTRELKEKILDKSLIIPNGINQYWHNNGYNNRNTKKERTIKILYVGRINKNKNIETTIKACEILLANNYDVTFTIIGQSEEKKILDKVKEKDFVVYHSSMVREKLIKEYRANDIFVMPSKFESFGLVYAEALSQGLPVIYTKNQGFDKQFPEGVVGYSVDPYNELDISNKIINIMDNYQNFSANSLKGAKKFNWEDIANKLIDIYMENKLR